MPRNRRASGRHDQMDRHIKSGLAQYSSAAIEVSTFAVKSALVSGKHNADERRKATVVVAMVLRRLCCCRGSS